MQPQARTLALSILNYERNLQYHVDGKGARTVHTGGRYSYRTVEFP